MNHAGSNQFLAANPKEEHASSFGKQLIPSLLASFDGQPGLACIFSNWLSKARKRQSFRMLRVKRRAPTWEIPSGMPRNRLTAFVHAALKNDPLVPTRMPINISLDSSQQDTPAFPGVDAWWINVAFGSEQCPIK